MSKRILIKSARPSRDAGVALIFALAVLALLLVMLVGFLASSILEHRIAYNQSSQVAARIAVRSALARAEVQLLNYSDPAWFRSRDNFHESNNTQEIQPLVSVSGTLEKTTQKNSAYPEMAELLKKYLAHSESSGSDQYKTLKNWFPNVNFREDDDDAVGHKDYYPQWIYLKADLEANDRITGRFAYVIIPNLGINPALFGTGLPGSPDRVGGASFEELPIGGLGFLTTVGQSVVKTPYGGAGFTDWMSLDLLSGGRGLGMETETKKCFSKTNVAKEFATGNVTNRELVNAYFTVDMLKAEEKSVDGNWQDGKGGDRTDLSEALSFTQARTLLSHIDESNNLRDQVAANLSDYTDSDDTPTSDVAPESWGTTAPKYTGNEMTPYINQILPTLHFTSTYTVTKTKDPVSGLYTVDQTITVKYYAEVTAELINIYPKNFPENNAAKKNMVTLKKLSIHFETSALQGETEGPGASPEGLPGVANGKETINVDFPDVIVDFKGKAVNARSYIYAVSEKTSEHTIKTFTCHSTDLAEDANVPKLTIQINGIANSDFTTVGPAILSWFSKKAGGAEVTQPVDYVEELVQNSLPPIYIAQFGGDAVKDASGGSNDIAVYTGFEAEDPRCNLKSEEWDKRSPSTLLPVSLGTKNHHADASNNGLTQEKDWEMDSDPKNLSTAYIRNAPMQSPWELAFIHRGAPWQTINLKSAVSPLDSGYSGKEKTYLNDGILWDKIKFSANTEDYKFNLNIPAQYKSAFGVLVRGLKYHDPEQQITTTGNSLDVTTGTALSPAAANELAQWIANKCYDAGGADPTDNTAKVYQRYIHRGMLANVILDWARRGLESPYRSNIKEAHLCELIGKIAALTRCGDTYEYFTVFAVGQAIKDVGSESGATFVRYDAAGTKTEKACQYGEFEDQFDQITAESYLVARIRRQLLSCQGKPCCKLGIHAPACTFKLTVLESYVLDEL